MVHKAAISKCVATQKKPRVSPAVTSTVAATSSSNPVASNQSPDGHGPGHGTTISTGISSPPSTGSEYSNSPFKMDEVIVQFINMRRRTRALESELHRERLARRQAEDEFVRERLRRRLDEDNEALDRQAQYEEEDTVLLKRIQAAVSQVVSLDVFWIILISKFQVNREDSHERHNQQQDPKLCLESIVDEVVLDIALGRVRSANGPGFEYSVLLAEEKRVKEELVLEGEKRSKRKGAKKYRS
jgi:hypothetical protein